MWVESLEELVRNFRFLDPIPRASNSMCLGMDKESVIVTRTVVIKVAHLSPQPPNHRHLPHKGLISCSDVPIQMDWQLPVQIQGPRLLTCHVSVIF